MTTGTPITPAKPHADHSPRRWGGRLSVVASILLRMLGGLGAFTFGHGKGESYFSNNPQSGANCHIMQDQFDTCQKSSHQHVAVCNDCHLPHDFAGKWITKADNGFLHPITSPQPPAAAPEYPAPGQSTHSDPTRSSST